MRPLGLVAATLLLVVPAPASTSSPPETSTWADVTAASGELTFCRRITGLVLTCPEADLGNFLTHIAELPAERRSWAQRLLTSAWLERAPQAALAYWRAHRADLPPDVQPVFYAKLALSDLPQAQADLAQEKNPEAADTYALTIIQAVSDKNPRGALALTGSLKEDSRWVVAPVLASLARVDRDQALAEAAKLPDHDLRIAAQTAVLHVWAETQPAEALRWADQNLPADAVESAAASLLGELARKNLADAERLAAELNLPAVNKAMESALGSLPPRQLYEKAASGNWKGIPDYALSGMIEYAARQSPADAIRFFKAVPAERLTGESDAKQLATAWTLLDPAGVQAWAAALPESSLRDEVALRINSMLTEVDPKFAVAQIKATPAGPLQARMVSNTAKAFSKKDLTGALAWVAGLPAGPNQDEALQGLAWIGADYNPAAMVKGLAAMPPGAAKTTACAQFAKRWVKEDPGAALDWFIQLPPGPERAAMQSTIFEEAAQHANDRALDLVKTITDRDEQASLVKQLADGLAVEDPAEALALVGALPESDKRHELSASVLHKLAAENPALAAKLALNENLGRRRASVLASISHNWANTSPADAAAWIDSLRQDPSLKTDMPRLSSSVAAAWASHDANQALAWVQRLPAGKEHDLALTDMAQSMAPRFPQKAFDLLASDPGVSKDFGQLNRVASDWLAMQPNTARQHIAASTLPEPIKQKLLTQKRPR